MKTRINLYSVYKWWWDILDTSDIPSTEQLTMFHMIQLINRNFWADTKVSINKLSAAMMKDKRTVKKALDNLVELGYLISKGDGYNVGYCNVRQNSSVGTESSTGTDDSESRENAYSLGSPEYVGERLPLQPPTDNGLLRDNRETPSLKRRGLFNR